MASPDISVVLLLLKMERHRQTARGCRDHFCWPVETCYKASWRSWYRDVSTTQNAKRNGTTPLLTALRNISVVLSTYHFQDNILQQLADRSLCQSAAVCHLIALVPAHTSTYSFKDVLPAMSK